MAGVSPAVSVLMTAYNREDYIRLAIESVLASPFTDLELIIVDDGSSDDTYAIAASYAHTDPRVRVFRNEQNLGDYANRNRAAGYARGRYLKFHDSDDVMYAQCLPIMVEGLAQYPSAACALSRGHYWPGGPVPMLLTPRLAYQREFLGSGVFGCGPSGALFRREIFEALGGFEDLGAPSDYLFWLRACAQYPVVLVAADLFWYRDHAGQERQQPRAQRQYAAAAARGWAALKEPGCPLSTSERLQARRNHAASVARQAWHALRAGDVSLAVFRVTHAGLSVGEWLRYLRRPRRHSHAGTPSLPASPTAPASS